MAFFDRLRLLFSTSTVGSMQPPDPVSTAVLPFSEPTMLPESMLTLANPTLPDWLADEDALRDEGILYGLSMARPDEKLALIRACFEQTTVGLAQQIEDFNVQIGTFNLLIDQQESRIQTIRTRLDALLNEAPADAQLLRTVVGLSLAVVMSIGNFYLIDSLLQPAFPTNRWVAVGVFLAGLAGGGSRSVGRVSMLRRVLDQGGLPVSASLFVLAESLQTVALWPALAGFGFVLTLFLLAGKWLPGYLTRLHDDWMAIAQNRRRQRDQRTKPSEWEREIEGCEQEISALRMKKWQLQPALSRTEATLCQQHAHRDRLLKLFDSEFQLARSQRDSLSEIDRMRIFSS